MPGISSSGITSGAGRSASSRISGPMCPAAISRRATTVGLWFSHSTVASAPLASLRAGTDRPIYGETARPGQDLPRPVDAVCPRRMDHATCSRHLLLYRDQQAPPGGRIGHPDRIVFRRDEDPETVEKNFHPTISHIRKALNSRRTQTELCHFSPNSACRLNPELSYSIDSEDFERHISEAEKAKAEGRGTFS